MSSLRRSQHVLVAQHRDQELELIREALAADLHMLVTQARTGEEAVVVLRGSGRHSSRPMPSLLLLDLELPDPPATEFIRELRSCARTSCMPVVGLAGSADRTLLEGAYDAGINSCLVKPATPAQYGELVLGVTQYWLKLNQLPQHLGAAGNDG